MSRLKPDSGAHKHSATVIGGGLAGSEAAWQLAERGFHVSLHEMRPTLASPAHHTSNLAELVCSNSFKSNDPSSAAGTLKAELARLGCRLLQIAHDTAVPAGGALAVDRALFSGTVTEIIERHPNIDLIRNEIRTIPDHEPVVVATGPLSSPGLDTSLSSLVGDGRLAFFDAAAPIVDADTIDRTLVFVASRYEKGDGADYLNCPMDRASYEQFIGELIAAERVTAQAFEHKDLFQACQPIEEVARNGLDAPRFGPLKPVGLTDPATGERPWAVVQLRAENRTGSAYNLVGFQTNLTFSEQRRILRMIPGLGNAEFMRYGVMHRNTFVDAPRILGPTLALRSTPNIYLAGQLAGTEGYTEAIATGLLAALNLTAAVRGDRPLVLPSTTSLGALITYATDPETKKYQPMHVNWGLVPPLTPPVRGKRARYSAYADRALRDLDSFLADRTSDDSVATDV